MNIFIAPIYCPDCRERTYQQVYALDWHAQHTCMRCGDVTIIQLREIERELGKQVKPLKKLGGKP